MEVSTKIQYLPVMNGRDFNYNRDTEQLKYHSLNQIALISPLSLYKSFTRHSMERYLSNW